MRGARALGALVAVAVFALDQASKFAVVHGFAATGSTPVDILPVLNLTLRWNPGISFSLLPQDTALGVWLLLGFTLAATGALAVWLWRTRSALIAFGLGAIIGGALGNAIDRFSYGAVVDFLDLHLGARHFFVFNLADAAINVGVVLLLIDGLLITKAAEPAKV